MPILRRRSSPALLLLAFTVGGPQLSSTFTYAASRQSQAASEDERAPERFDVRLETSKGTVTIDVHRDWAPRGVDRFYTLILRGYYDNSRLFRVVAGRWALFGIAGDPAVSKRWRERTFPDDPE